MANQISLLRRLLLQMLDDPDINEGVVRRAINVVGGLSILARRECQKSGLTYEDSGSLTFAYKDAGGIKSQSRGFSQQKSLLTKAQ